MLLIMSEFSLHDTFDNFSFSNIKCDIYNKSRENKENWKSTIDSPVNSSNLSLDDSIFMSESSSFISLGSSASISKTISIHNKHSDIFKNISNCESVESDRSSLKNSKSHENNEVAIDNTFNENGSHSINYINNGINNTNGAESQENGSHKNDVIANSESCTESIIENTIDMECRREEVSDNEATILSSSENSNKITQSYCTNTSQQYSQNYLQLSSWGLPIQILQKYHQRNIINMFPWQVECLNKPSVLQNKKNLLYSAPTSAGKTLVAEILAIKTVLERQKKVLFILPFVSVVREKMFYFQDIFGTSGVRVEGFMGSYNPPGGFRAIQVAICTIEKANSLINRLLEEGHLSDIGAVIVDEMHLLGDPHRGYLLELLLTKLRYMSLKSDDINIQIVGMSATLPNLEVLAKWLDAELYTTSFRPIPLHEMCIVNGDIYDSRLTLIRTLGKLKELDVDSDSVLQLCLETIGKSCSVLIFCPTKNWCESLAQQIASNFYKLGSSSSPLGLKLREELNSEAIMECLEQLKRCPVGIDNILSKTISFGVAFHHAGLTIDERDIVEGGFRTGSIRVLVATSTLSSGVNLPARRVIIRTPIFHGKPIDTLTYRQMIGRAGRMGKDTEGESLLVCQQKDYNIAKELMSNQLQPVESCLEHSGRLKRAILEIIASEVASTPEEVCLFTRCTLLANDSNRIEISNPIEESIDFLTQNQFIRLQVINETCSKYVATSLAKACLSSSMPPEEGLALFTELEKARQCFVLETELHLIYLVTPYSVCNQLGNIDWMQYLDMWEKLSASMKRVGDLIGIKISYIINGTRGKIQTNTSKAYQKLQIHKRFYIALALQDLVNEVPLQQVATKFNCNRGMIQSLQQSAATFAGMVTSFSKQLGWSSVELLVSQFQGRLHFGVSKDLLDLMKLPIINGQQARTLYNAGIESLVDLANSDVYALENVLHKAKPFESEKEREGESEYDAKKRNNLRSIWISGMKPLTEKEAAIMLIADARKYLTLEMGVCEAKWEDKITIQNLSHSNTDVGLEESHETSIEQNKHDNQSQTNTIKQIQTKETSCKLKDKIEKHIDSEAVTMFFNGFNAKEKQCNKNIINKNINEEINNSVNIKDQLHQESKKEISKVRREINNVEEMKVMKTSESEKNMAFNISKTKRFSPNEKSCRKNNEDNKTLKIDNFSAIRTANYEYKDPESNIVLKKRIYFPNSNPRRASILSRRSSDSTVLTSSKRVHRKSSLDEKISKNKELENINENLETVDEDTTSNNDENFNSAKLINSSKPLAGVNDKCFDNSSKETQLTNSMLFEIDVILESKINKSAIINAPLKMDNINKKQQTLLEEKLIDEWEKTILERDKQPIYDSINSKFNLSPDSNQSLFNDSMNIDSHLLNIGDNDSQMRHTPNTEDIFGDDSKYLRNESIDSSQLGCQEKFTEVKENEEITHNLRKAIVESPYKAYMFGNGYKCLQKVSKFEKEAKAIMEIDSQHSENNTQKSNKIVQAVRKDNHDGGIDCNLHCDQNRITKTYATVKCVLKENDIESEKSLTPEFFESFGLELADLDAVLNSEEYETQEKVESIQDSNKSSSRHLEQPTNIGSHKDTITKPNLTITKPTLETLDTSKKSNDENINGVTNLLNSFDVHEAFQSSFLHLNSDCNNVLISSTNVNLEINDSNLEQRTINEQLGDHNVSDLVNTSHEDDQPSLLQDIIKSRRKSIDQKNEQHLPNLRKRNRAILDLDNEKSTKLRKVMIQNVSTKLPQALFSKELKNYDDEDTTLEERVKLRRRSKELKVETQKKADGITKNETKKKCPTKLQGLELTNDRKSKQFQHIKSKRTSPRLQVKSVSKDILQGNPNEISRANALNLKKCKKIQSNINNNLLEVKRSIGNKPFDSSPNAESTYLITDDKCPHHAIYNTEDADCTDFNDLKIIDVYKNPESLNVFKTEILTKNELSIAVGCTESTAVKPVIGCKVLKKESAILKRNEMRYKDILIDNICVSWGGYTAYYINLKIDSKEMLSFLNKVLKEKDLLVRIFDSKEHIKIFKKACDIDIEVQLEDPKVADWLLDPEIREKNLQAMAATYSPEVNNLCQLAGQSKGVGSIALNVKNTADARIRAAVECVVTWHLVDSLKAEFLRRGNLLRTYEIEMMCMQILASMELAGFAVDLNQLHTLSDDLKSYLSSLENKAYEIAGRRFSFTSSREVATVLGIYKGKRVSTNKQILEQSENPLSKLIIQWRKINSTLTKMIYPLIRLVENNRVHGNCVSYSSTGRISMHEPNLQYIAKDFDYINPLTGETLVISCRDAFIANDKNVLVSADYCQLELRIMAHLSNDETLCKIMKVNNDVFRSIAAKWNNISEDEVTEVVRQQTKQICYGIIYGMGMRTLAEQLEISEDQALEFSERFHQKYPALKIFINSVVAKCRDNGYVETIGGRKRYLPNINDQKISIKNQAERQAVNTTVQGSAADIVKNAMVLIEKKVRDKFKSSRNKPKLVLHLHDELIYEVSEKYKDVFARLLKKCMQESVNLSIPFPVKVKSGKSWARLQEIKL